MEVFDEFWDNKINFKEFKDRIEKVDNSFRNKETKEYD